MIPLFDHIIYPALRSVGINHMPTKRMYTSFLVCGLAFFYSPILQKFIYENHHVATITPVIRLSFLSNDRGIWC